MFINAGVTDLSSVVTGINSLQKTIRIACTNQFLIKTDVVPIFKLQGNKPLNVINSKPTALFIDFL
jgi:hypothetical protein